MATATVNKKSRKTASAVAVAQCGEATLEKIVEATLDNSVGFLHTSPAVHVPLIEAGLVEINPEIINQAGEVATRATEKGIAAVNANVQPAVTAVAGKPSFVLESNIPVPTVKRGGRGGDMYPFDSMEVGQSFFVAATEDKPEPAKSLASTVSSATARYAVPAEDGAMKTNRKGVEVPVMIETRKFVIRSMTENGTKGARIWRTL